MKLYLSSFGLGKHPSEMLDLNAKNNRVAVIQNAQDFWTDSKKRQAVFERECKGLESLGLKPTELDLRKYFGRPNELTKEIEGFGYCWACGGNTFVLRRAYSLSGFDEVVSNLADQDSALVYGGYSAGACVMTPTLEGIHLADDPTSTPDGYTGETRWDGVGIYPYCIAPHYKSDHPESPLIDKSVEYFIEKRIPFIALRDGEAMLYNTITQQNQSL